MKHTHLHLALFLASWTWALASHAQPSAPAQEPPQVNPMTGRTLSEEALTRSLSRAKLETQIQQETVKQSQQRSDLALALLRQSAEEYRLRQETGIGSNKQPTIPASPSVRPAPKPKQLASSRALPAPVAVAPTPPANQIVPTVPAVRVAGTVTIGRESSQILSAYVGAPATIQSVDPQKAAASVDSRPMVAPRNFAPLDIAPVPGGMPIPIGVPGIAIPAIPGYSPASR